MSDRMVVPVISRLLSCALVSCALVSCALVLGAGPALAASDPAEKVAALLAEKKADKAWALCEKQKESGPLSGTLKDVCGDVAFGLLLDQSGPSGPSIDRLSAFAELWKGAPAAEKAQDMASKRSLIAAGDDAEALGLVTATWPGSAAANEAYSRLWKKTVAANTSAAMHDFRTRYPSAPQAGDAEKMERDLAWIEASKTPTLDGLRRFRLTWPEHPKKDQARALEESLAFAAAEANNTVSGWEALIQQYPAHPRLAEAKTRALDAGYLVADSQGPDALLAFALAHPEYPKAASVLATLLKSRTLVQGGAAGGTPVTLLPLGATPSATTLPAGSNTLTVRLPVPGVLPALSVELLANGQRQALDVSMPARLKAAGVADAQIPSSWAVRTAVVDGASMLTLPAGLCQPDGGDLSFVLLVAAGGLELGYPFRLTERCGPARAGGSR